MPEPLVYVDRSAVRDGSLEELKVAIRELAEFVEANVARAVSYGVFFSEDGRRMTVVHVHADPTSLDDHMRIAGPRFGRFAELVELEAIDVYGAPSEDAVRALHEKARLLGGEVSIHPLHAGFIR